jgi:hypothetical protein
LFVAVSYGQYGGQSTPDDLIITGTELMVEFSAAATTGNDSSWLVGQGVLANVRLLGECIASRYCL